MTTGVGPATPAATGWGGAVDRLYAPLAVVALAMIPIVAAVARGDTPARLAIAGLVLEAAVLLALRSLEGGARGARTGWRGALSVGLHGLLGVGTCALGYFLGPHSGLAGFLSALLVMIGIASSGPGVRRKGWAAYLSVALGQAALVALIVTDVLADRSMLPLGSSTLPAWKLVAVQVAVQGVYGGAFVTGAAIARRYAVLVRATEGATRVAIHREALVAEARAEHQRALHAGGYGVFAGQRVGGYRLRALIGRGGMGEVYDATDDDGQVVALKVMRGDRLGDPDALARLRQEAAALARVDSPYVARLYAAGGAEHELPFVAMERCDGDNLEALARPTRPLAGAELGRLADHASRALEAVHAAGLVHRDVSPGNLVRTTVDGEARWRLVDFGIAGPPGEVRDLAPVGTLRYIAPEQLGAGVIDGRSDVHGLGLCLYLAATGRPPFPHETRDALCAAIAGAMPVAPSALAAVSLEVEHVLRIAIAKAPADRFADAAALRAAMAAALEGALPDAVRAHAERLAATLPWAPLPADAGPAGDDVVTLVEGITLPTWTLPLVAVEGGRGRSATPVTRAARDESSESVGVPTRAALTSPWDRAYVDKLVEASRVLLGLSTGGALLLTAIAVRRMPLVIALACMAAIALLSLVLLRAARRHGMAAGHRWLWGGFPLLAVGPSYFFGLTSAFAAVVGAFLFQTGLQTWSSTRARAPSRAIPWFELQFLAGTVLSQTAAFVAIVAGALPDAGLYPVLMPGAPGWEPWLAIAGVQGVYIGAMVVASRLDRGFQAQIHAADAAARAAARAQALLDTARRKLRRALGHARPRLFTGHAIGNYQLGPLVGRGGMGEVYDAVHAASGRRAAVKLLRTDRLGDRRTLERFLREAVALSRLDSDHVARVYEVGGLDGELPHIAMEFLDGKDLGAWLHDGPGLERPAIAALVADVTRGLAAAHHAGVVHRDVKPRNLVRVTTPHGGLWKVVDFGVAKLVDHGTHTSGLAIVGTPAYMAPEQAAGRAVDARTDLYALGLVIYRLVVGRPALAGDTVLTGGQPPDPRGGGDVGEDLELALRIALAPEPADRFATAAELGAAFADAFGDRLAEPLRARGAALRARYPWRPA